MTDNLDYSVRAVDADDLPKLLEWRNHPEIRKYMITQHEITLEEHLAWFQRVEMDHQRCLLMIERKGRPMGYVQFSGITGDCADWGFYVAPGSPKGSGRGLAMAALTHAFGSMSLKQVRGKALSYNQASIRLHLRCGFREEHDREQAKRDDGRTEEVCCFVLDRSTWRKVEAENA
jgi:UDP-4-amino-4,6-dideoxy-N-acetyl-beta-L-altrosamine N-acetyltransferase